MIMTPVNRSEYSFFIIRLIHEIIFIEILLVYQKIVEAIVLTAAYIFHITVNFIKVNLINYYIVLNKNYVLFIVNPEISVKNMLCLFLIEIIRNIRVAVSSNVKYPSMHLKPRFLKALVAQRFEFAQC